MIKSLTRLLLLLTCAAGLSACAAHKAASADFDMPLRAPLQHAQVHARLKDGICPESSDYYMSEDEFKALLQNVINTEAYIKQLENILEQFRSKE